MTKPVVDRLEAEQASRLRVIHLNVQDAAGRALAADYHANFTPTFILLDASGLELWRGVGALNPSDVTSRLQP